MHRLIYDLQLAAAARGYFLEVYQGEVDQDGFDIILDDRDLLKKIQVKTVISGSGVSSWHIHKALLRPHYLRVEELGFEPSPEGEGYEGGVVLMDFKCSESSVSVDYRYTDVFVLKAFDLGIIRRRRKRECESIRSLYRELRNGTSHDKIRVNKSAFVRTGGSQHVLALAGLHSVLQTAWPTPLTSYLGGKEEIHKRCAGHELRKLICDDNVVHCEPPFKEE